MTLEPDTIVQVLLRERLRVTGLAAAVTRDVHAADDIFQQVVLAALESRAQFRGHNHVLAWALRAARHRAVDFARSRRLRSLPDDVLDLLEARWADPASAATSYRGEALHKCIGRLTTFAQELLQMRYAEGLTVTALAERLRRTVDAIYQTLSRTHRALRVCVERELHEHEAPDERGVSS
jgi:RNA polymerase sigma factor (sigma-70 family)